jgi:predicted dehydrogenase
VCAPDFLHEEMAVAALELGLAVYLEKPMAITTEGCDRILKSARESNARLYLGHNMRHMAFVRKMKELIDGGAIGEVKTVWCRHFVGHGGDFYFKDWHATRENTNSMLLQKGAHDIDVIHWLAGGYSDLVHALGNLTVYNRALQNPNLNAPEKTAFGEAWPPLSQRGLNPQMDIEDLYLMQMRLDNDVLAAYQECHYSPDYWRNYTVIGTEGRLENIGDGGEGTSIHLWNKRHIGWSAPDEIIPIEIGDGGHGGSDPNIVAEFVRFAREGGQTTTSPLAARYSVAAGCAATQFAAERRHSH